MERLKPDDVNDTDRVIMDGIGDIATISRADIEEFLAGIKPLPVPW